MFPLQPASVCGPTPEAILINRQKAITSDTPGLADAGGFGEDREGCRVMVSHLKKVSTGSRLRMERWMTNKGEINTIN